MLEGRYGPECDVWSAGVMMYILLCGYPPFNAPSDRGIMSKVRTGHYTFPDGEWSKVSLQAKDLISRLLDRHPRTRISAEQAIRHRWFTMHMPDSVANEPLGEQPVVKTQESAQTDRACKAKLQTFRKTLGGRAAVPRARVLGLSHAATASALLLLLHARACVVYVWFVC